MNHLHFSLVERCEKLATSKSSHAKAQSPKSPQKDQRSSGWRFSLALASLLELPVCCWFCEGAVGQVRSSTGGRRQSVQVLCVRPFIFFISSHLSLIFRAQQGAALPR